MTARKWIEREVSTFDKFIEFAESYYPRLTWAPPLFFRGQPNAEYNLVPSLLRIVGADSRQNALAMEKVLGEEFVAQASLFPETAAVWSALKDGDNTERWAMMQHHGCPTRLLDWTGSPYVAAYFAVEQQLDHDGAVFMIHPGSFVPELAPGTSKDVPTDDPSLPPRVIASCPDIRSRRVVAQQGHFTFNTHIAEPHDEAILEAHARDGWEHAAVKIVIPAAAKTVFLSHLRVMNVAAHSLFPTLDGLGRSLGEMARIQIAAMPELKAIQEKHAGAAKPGGAS